MKVQDVQRLNAMLRSLPCPEDYRPELCIDTFHHPYIALSEKIVLPSVNLISIESGQAERVLRNVIDHAPAFVSDCNVLPESRPRRESNQLHLVRAHTLSATRPMAVQYLYIFKISMEYLGGAQPDEIRSPARQGISPEVLTNRIYFHARLVPVREIQLENDCIVDFEPLRLRDALFQNKSVGQGPGDKWSSALFDAVDFSELNARFTDMFAFGVDREQNKIFYPLLIEYLTLTMNLVYPHFKLVTGLVPYFDECLQSILRQGDLQDVSDETRRFFQKYLAGFKHRRHEARSGNPHWQLTQYPSADISV